MKVKSTPEWIIQDDSCIAFPSGGLSLEKTSMGVAYTQSPENTTQKSGMKGRQEKRKDDSVAGMSSAFHFSYS